MGCLVYPCQRFAILIILMRPCHERSLTCQRLHMRFTRGSPLLPLCLFIDNLYAVLKCFEAIGLWFVTGCYHKDAAQILLDCIALCAASCLCAAKGHSYLYASRVCLLPGRMAHADFEKIVCPHGALGCRELINAVAIYVNVQTAISYLATAFFKELLNAGIAVIVMLIFRIFP